MSEFIIDMSVSSYQSRSGLLNADVSQLREEIVRCRDCRAMCVKYGNTGIECWMSGEPFTVELDGFCAWGRRKDGEA